MYITYFVLCGMLYSGPWTEKKPNPNNGYNAMKEVKPDNAWADEISAGQYHGGLSSQSVTKLAYLTIQPFL